MDVNFLEEDLHLGEQQTLNLRDEAWCPFQCESSHVCWVPPEVARVSCREVHSRRNEGPKSILTDLVLTLLLSCPFHNIYSLRIQTLIIISLQASQSLSVVVLLSLEWRLLPRVSLRSQWGTAFERASQDIQEERIPTVELLLGTSLRPPL